MDSNHVEERPVTTFTKFEVKFAKQSGRRLYKRLFIGLLAAVFLVSGFYLTMIKLGELNKDIAGVFETKEILIEKGKLEAAEGHSE